MSPILFEYGPIRIGVYGTLLAIALLCASWVLKREFRRRNLDPTLADSIAFAAMIGGILGAKIFHVFEYPHTFFTDPFGAIFSTLGWAWYGGFLGGAAAVLFTLRRNDALDWPAIDAIAPALVVGYFFGRGGCELSGDGCYGIETDLPWARTYPNGIVPTLDHVHPTPIYEMLQMVCIYGILWALRDKLRPGMTFAIYLILMAIGRFFVEFVRLTPEVFIGLTVHQWVSIGLILIGLYLISKTKTADVA